MTDPLINFVCETRWQDIPDRVQHEARRSLLNGIATALSGCREPAIQIGLSVLQPFSGAGKCTVIGRTERVDMLLAAFLNAGGANIFDFDDTHPQTIIHPTAPIAPALFAFAQERGCSGQDLLRAFILGGEVQCRIGNAVSPSHYSRGWHITSTCGVFGATVAVGALLGLNPSQMNWALGNASAQAGGLVETLGTMSKSIGVGNAARNGIVSALLAAEGYSGPAEPLTGRSGFLPVFSDTPNADALTNHLGQEWEIARNTYKPYPVGVVLNPVVDACLQLYREQGVRSDHVARVELTGNSLLSLRANRPDITTGRESQVSAQHAIAIALSRGRAGLPEFNDDAVDETRRAGRPQVVFHSNDQLGIESVDLVLTTHDEQQHRLQIRDAKGSGNNPMSDQDLQDKLRALAEYGQFSGDTDSIADAVWNLDKIADAAQLVALLSKSEVD
ncbi:MAG: MmgE/PrpD family protein [Burkholderiaceae bacterium]